MNTSSSRSAVVVIPARGGSKGIPLKNLEPVGASSLLARAVKAALGAPHVREVVVSTDHPGIAEEARAAGARVVDRPDDLAGDQATSESAVIHTLDALADDAEVTVLMQCTSPFVDSRLLESAIVRVLEDAADVVFSAAEDHGFLWSLNGEQAEAVGHDASFRPRRQDRAPQFRETGAFYAMRTTGLREHGHRFFGRTGLELVAEADAIEIDTPADLEFVRALAAARGETPAAPDAIDVDALVTDFDGVHTDDAAIIGVDGSEQVRVHRGDGLGIARLRESGLPMLILSKERHPVVGARGQKLGVEVRQGVDRKAAALVSWMTELGLDPARVAYIGNDINDLEAFEQVGWPIAVADARPEVRRAARIVLTASGGDGAVREASDRILAARVKARPGSAPGKPAETSEQTTEREVQ